MSFSLIILLIIFKNIPYFNYNFSSELNILIVLIISSIFFNFGYISSKIYIIFNNTKMILYRNFFLLLASLVLSVILTPKFGVMGSCSSTLIALILSHFLLDVTQKKPLDFLLRLKFKSIFLK